MLITTKSAFILLAAMALVACSQTNPDPRRTISPITPQPRMQEKTNATAIDKSSMDMSYYPVDYPVLKMSGKIIGPPIARVIYSRPSRDGRTIFGDVVKYGSPWRLGANEASEIEFFTDVNIEGKLMKKGRYVIYCIPYKDKWTIVFNDDLFTWGLKINRSKDIFLFDIPVVSGNNIYEVFTMEFEKTSSGILLAMAWGNVKAELPIVL